jgi:hypothetical protein
MRPIPRCFVAVVLVGCFVTAVAVAGELGCDGSYKGRTLSPEELATVLHNHQAWLASDRKWDDERRANLCQANLFRAKLLTANLEEANLSWANLQGANLTRANLQGAYLAQN